VLFNEPKLLKPVRRRCTAKVAGSFSALQRAEIAETMCGALFFSLLTTVSVLFNEPKLLKPVVVEDLDIRPASVSVLFNEPKLLKSLIRNPTVVTPAPFQCSSTSRNC